MGLLRFTSKFFATFNFFLFLAQIIKVEPIFAKCLAISKPKPWFAPVIKKDKYLIRCFYQKPYAGSKEWFDGEEKYGKDEWYKMQKEKVDREQSEFMRIQLEGMKNDN